MMMRKLYTLAELRAMSASQRAALMPSAAATVGSLLADIADKPRDVTQVTRKAAS